jgi:hypothetical protein
MVSGGLLSDVTFDSADGQLFQVADLRLRADALRYSVLPRLHVLLKASVSRVHDVYQVDALADRHPARRSHHPAFPRGL